MFKLCKICGKQLSKKQQKFCSLDCLNEYFKRNPNGRKYNNYVIMNDYAIIKINSKKFGELDCIVDKNLVEDLVKNHYWRLRHDKRHNNLIGYIEATKNGNRVHLHRLITNCPKDSVVDHINGNTLDNRLSNLRITNQSVNALNKHTTIDKGVFYNKRDDVYIAHISIKGKTKYLGYYRTKEEAIKRRDFANKLIKETKINELKSLTCEKLKLQRNNHSGHKGISVLKNGKFEVRYNSKYIGRTDNIETALKMQKDFINKLCSPLIE